MRCVGHSAIHADLGRHAAQVVAALGSLTSLTRLLLETGGVSSQMQLLEQVSRLQRLQELALLTPLHDQGGGPVLFSVSQLTTLTRLTSLYYDLDYGTDDSSVATLLEALPALVDLHLNSAGLQSCGQLWVRLRS